jgi:hypothetical protein
MKMSHTYTHVKESVEVRTSYTGVVGDADAAVAVESDGCHLACTSGSMFVVPVVARHGIIVIVIDVSAGMLVLQQIGPQVNAISARER